MPPGSDYYEKSKDEEEKEEKTTENLKSETMKEETARIELRYAKQTRYQNNLLESKHLKVGDVIIRTGSNKNGDRSFSGNPVKVTSKHGKHTKIEYIDGPTAGHQSILSHDLWADDKWIRWRE